MAGDNLNYYKRIQVLKAETAEELEMILQSIKQPINLETIYFDGKNHIAWVIPAVGKIRVERGKELKNGNTSSRRRNQRRADLQ